MRSVPLSRYGSIVTKRKCLSPFPSKISEVFSERRKKKADAAGPAIEKATAAAEEAKLQGYCQQQ